MLSPTGTKDKKGSNILIRMGKGFLNICKLRQKKTSAENPIPAPVEPAPAPTPIYEEPVVEETKPELTLTTNEEGHSTFFLFLCSDELKAASAAVLFVGTIAIALAVFSPSILGAAATIALLTGTGMTTVSTLTMVVSFGCGFFKKQLEDEIWNESYETKPALS